MPATTLSAVLFPDPLRPMMPYVCPGATANDTPWSAGNFSSGCRSWIRLPFNSALFSVANCFFLAYRRYTFVTLVSSMAFMTSSHFLGERVAQAIEEEVAEEKQ